MAKFRDEPAPEEAKAAWSRVCELIANQKTVEVYQRTEQGERRIYLRVWTGKREDGSNRVDADEEVEY